MKRKEARERLLRVGIIDPDNDGELSDQYCTKRNVSRNSFVVSNTSKARKLYGEN
jgi:hypothetical protein